MCVGMCNKCVCAYACVCGCTAHACTYRAHPVPPLLQSVCNFHPNNTSPTDTHSPFIIRLNPRLSNY